MLENREPYILSSQDSYARSLAESAYHLNETVVSFREKVIKYANENICKTWESTVDNRDADVKQISASDFISKYVTLRFSELFKELWVDREDMSHLGPHTMPTAGARNSTFDKDQITIIVEKKLTADTRTLKYKISAEDENGLGVIFERLDEPIAYGPRKFAKRVALLNQKWSDGGSTMVSSSQALLVLVEESKNLEFKPQNI